jgi:siroheme synthase-like protein
MSSLNKENIDKDTAGNQLFPVFLKLNELRVLLVGAGNVGLEKLTALISNSPDTRITIVAEHFSEEVRELAGSYSRILSICRAFKPEDLEGQDLVVIATGDNVLNAEIRKLAREKHLLINVADKPELCDFYLGSIVKKGDLKIGISTNGKSPTMAKRLKELFQESLPDELDTSLQQLNQLRNKLNGDFAHKVEQLNKATAMLLNPPESKDSPKRISWLMCGAGFALVLLLLYIFLPGTF